MEIKSKIRKRWNKNTDVVLEIKKSKKNNKKIEQN